MTEIFTAGYIAKPKGTLKLFTTNYKAGLKAGAQQHQQQQRQASGSQLTSKPVRLVTTQQVRKESRNPSSLTSLHTRNERIPTGPRNPEPLTHSGGRHNDRRQDDVYVDRRPTHGNQSGSLSTRHGNNNINSSINHANNGHSNNAQRNGNSQPERNVRQDPSPRVQLTTKAPAPVPAHIDLDMDIDMGDTPIAIRGSAPGTNVAFRGESGPVTVEIENLDPETTADDVKVRFSRPGLCVGITSKLI